jgi:hypothetical protein
VRSSLRRASGAPEELIEPLSIQLLQSTSPTDILLIHNNILRIVTLNIFCSLVGHLTHICGFSLNFGNRIDFFPGDLRFQNKLYLQVIYKLNL